MRGNVKIEPTATAIRAIKQNAGDAKIDPWATLMNGVWMMSRNPEARGTSGWNTDDIDGLMAKIDAAVVHLRACQCWPDRAGWRFDRAKSDAIGQR